MAGTRHYDARTNKFCLPKSCTRLVRVQSGAGAGIQSRCGIEVRFPCPSNRHLSKLGAPIFDDRCSNFGEITPYVWELYGW